MQLSFFVYNRVLGCSTIGRSLLMLAGCVNEVLLVGEEKDRHDEDDVPLTQLLIQKVSRGCAMRGDSPHVAHAKKIFDRDEVEFMIYDICRSTKKKLSFYRNFRCFTTHTC